MVLSVLSKQERFNTQPPEGGWFINCVHMNQSIRFQHTAARRRLGPSGSKVPEYVAVSTHSRPKAAGFSGHFSQTFISCFNTQPPEGGWSSSLASSWAALPFQHTAARRRLGKISVTLNLFMTFQHTAARRRLVNWCRFELQFMGRFQHTAARRRLGNLAIAIISTSCFNTQPPEGGWGGGGGGSHGGGGFNTQPPEGGWE